MTKFIFILMVKMMGGQAKIFPKRTRKGHHLDSGVLNDNRYLCLVYYVDFINYMFLNN